MVLGFVGEPSNPNPSPNTITRWSSAEHKFFTPEQAAEIFQRTESELKKKHPAAYPGGFKSPPHAVFANPGGDVDGDNAISVAELLSAIPRLYSEPVLQQCAPARPRRPAHGPPRARRPPPPPAAPPSHRSCRAVAGGTTR